MGYDFDFEDDAGNRFSGSARKRPEIPEEYVDAYWEQHEALIRAQTLRDTSHPLRDALILFLAVLAFFWVLPGIIVVVRMQSVGFDSAVESVEESIIAAVVIASFTGLSGLIWNFYKYKKVRRKAGE